MIVFTGGRAWEPDLLKEGKAAFSLPLSLFRETLKRSEMVTRKLVFLLEW
jgi:hypothetical protein